jgi:hypothetical protein
MIVMTNRIRSVQIQDRVLDPAKAEVGIAVYPETVNPQTEIRGRLMGPRCPFATTVEVAYAMQPESRQTNVEGEPRISLRTIIPDPCRWDPESPFLYQAHVEVWQSGQRCDQADLSHGLRTIKLGPRGLAVNDKPFRMRGIARPRIDVDGLLSLRRQAFNTLLVPIDAEFSQLCATAGRIGFLVIGRDWAARDLPISDPSFFGCLLSDDDMQLESTRVAASTFFWRFESPRVGAELTRTPAAPIPGDIRFVYCDPNLLDSVVHLNLGKIIRMQEKPKEDQQWHELMSSPGVLGWIWQGE